MIKIPSYDDIITIFERFKDSECATLIVRHLPVSYVYENKEVLASKVGWQRVIAVIGKEYPETIDFSKLNSNEKIFELCQIIINSPTTSGTLKEGVKVFQDFYNKSTKIKKQPSDSEMKW